MTVLKIILSFLFSQEAESYKIKPDMIKPTQKNTAKITLNDCLACSGCVTTAETILMEQQSIDQFLKSVRSNKPTFITISPQCRSSLAHYFSISELEAHKRLALFFKINGVGYYFSHLFEVQIIYYFLNFQRIL